MLHTGKAWRHFVNQLSRRLPEVPNPNCQIPGKTQSQIEKDRVVYRCPPFGTWDLILYWDLKLGILEPALISSLSAFIPRWGDLEGLS